MEGRGGAAVSDKRGGDMRCRTTLRAIACHGAGRFLPDRFLATPKVRERGSGGRPRSRNPAMLCFFEAFVWTVSPG